MVAKIYKIPVLNRRKKWDFFVVSVVIKITMRGANDAGDIKIIERRKKRREISISLLSVSVIRNINCDANKKNIYIRLILP